MIKKCKTLEEAIHEKLTFSTTCVILVIMTVFEIFAVSFKSMFVNAAFITWIVFAFFYFIVSGIIIVKALKTDINEKNWFSLIILAGIVFIIFWGYGNFNMINLDYEGAKQVTGGLLMFSDPEKYYIGTAHLGYPAKSYALLAIPTLILGKGIYAAVVGYDLMLLFSVLLMYAGIRKIIVSNFNNKPYWSALLVLAFFTFPYVLRFMYAKQHDILMPAFVMQAIGWLAVIWLKPKPAHYLALAFIGGLLTSTYTPSFASFALLLAILSLDIIVKTIKGGIKTFFSPQNAAQLCIMAYMVSFLATAVLAMRNSEYEGSFGIVTERIYEGFKIFFLNNPVSFLGVLYPVIIIYFILSPFIMFRKNLDVFKKISIAGIMLWSIGVVIYASSAQGFWLQPVHFFIQRAMLIIPILLILALFEFFHLVKFTGNLQKERIASGIVLVVLCIGIYSSATMEWPQIPVARLNRDETGRAATAVIARDIYNQIRLDNLNEDAQVLYFTDSWETTNLNDYLFYFAPEVNVSVVVGDGNWGLYDASIVYATIGAIIPPELGKPEVITLKNDLKFQRLMIVH